MEDSSGLQWLAPKILQLYATRAARVENGQCRGLQEHLEASLSFAVGSFRKAQGRGATARCKEAK